MDLSGILAIGGKPGLYRMVSQTKNGMIVEGMDDKKRFPVYSAHQISALEEISIYTYEEDVPLKEVFKNMQATLAGDSTPNAKASKNELMGFFEKVLPNYNEEQVYASDVKKVIQWYNTLEKNDLLHFEDEESKEEKTPDENQDA
jgi:hypothetical protein